ncbi:MAG: hypothetical protein NVS2B7_35590 [Herpetosiphon sp.]
MDLCSPQPNLPEQLPLPLPPDDLSPSTTPIVLTPPHLWASLSQALQTDCRTTIVRILQEVLHDRLNQ